MMNDLIQQIVRRAREGDRAAEEELFGFLLVRFRLFTARRIKDSQGADDVAQDACVTIIEKYKTETFTVGFEAWAWGVLQTKIRRYFSRRSAEEKRMTFGEVDSQIRDSRLSAIDEALETRLGECLRKVAAVNPRYARVLNLVHQGYKTHEICARLKIDANHLYVLLYRARTMLSACLERGEI